MPKNLMVACLLAYIAIQPLAHAEEHAVGQYVDPSQLDCPFPMHSFYKQPWRGFMETRSGYDFLQGIGINYNLPKNDEPAVAMLAEAGFKDFRIEIGWGSVNWDETKINNSERYLKLLRLCKQHGVRPTLLLNANHGVPCPVRFFDRKLAAQAKKGDTTVTLADTKDVAEGYTGICGLSGYIAAEVIFTHVDPATGQCKLSMPLPKDLGVQKPLSLGTLKYLPLFPVGTKQYEESAKGWLTYARLVTGLAGEAGIDDFDLEIWNELSFGSNFVHASNYYKPAPFKETADFLHPGGTCWELTRRTIEQTKKQFPHSRCIWGWSNTTFYHCPIKDLPPGTDGQSYHPYGTGLREDPKEEDHKDHPDYNQDGYTPALQMRMPEGGQEFIKTECLMRLLNMQWRRAHPANTEHFHHYMTEHGVAPPECGVTDAPGAWRLKSKCALRSYCLWMNKGVDTLEYFCAYDKEATGMGLLPPDMLTMPPGSRFDDVATEPMKAVRNLTCAFDGAAPIEQTTPMQVDVTEIGPERTIFAGDGKHPPLMQREALAVLPWQVNKRRFVIAVYAMTYDATRPWEPQSYRLKIGGLPVGEHAELSCIDPLEGKNVAVESSVADGQLTVTLPVMDYPRLLVIGH